MSLIGKKPISIPEGVKVVVDGNIVSVSGPKGELKKTLPKHVELKIDADGVLVSVKGKEKSALVSHGTTRALVANMVQGVSAGWEKTLELVGTGYRAETTGKQLTLQVGYSHPIKFDAPEGIDFKVEKSEITVRGTEKEMVGLICAKIKFTRPPDPYKGKGVKFKGEVIRRKPGKAAKTAGA